MGIIQKKHRTVRIWDFITVKCVKVLHNATIYQNMNIIGAIGLTDAQKVTLQALGAVFNL